MRAYSIGIANPTIRRDTAGKAHGGIITGGEIVEISLVDRPANKSCGIRLVKCEKGIVTKTFGNVPKLTKAEKKTAKEIKKAKAHKPSDDEKLNWQLSQWLQSDSPVDREAAREVLKSRGVYV